MRKQIKQDPNEYAKQCVIIHNDTAMLYDDENRRLYLSDEYTVFPSRHKALRALHRAILTEKAEGRVEEWKEYYKVVEI